MTDVALTGYELTAAAYAGVARRVVAMRDERSREPGRRDLFERDCVGAIGEFAVAKALERFWSPAVGFLDTDTGDLPGIQVKAVTRSTDSLIVRSQDPAEMPYILALVTLELLPTVRLAGWAFGHEAKQDSYWRDVDAKRGIHQAAFFAPQSILRPLDQLELPPAGF